MEVNEADCVLVEELLRCFPPAEPHGAKDEAWQDVVGAVNRRLGVSKNVGTAKSRFNRLRQLHQQAGGDEQGKAGDRGAGRQTRATSSLSRVRLLLQDLFARYPTEEAGQVGGIQEEEEEEEKDGEGEGEGKAKAKAKPASKSQGKRRTKKAAPDHGAGRGARWEGKGAGMPGERSVYYPASYLW
jgi:hypothetical protein